MARFRVQGLGSQVYRLGSKISGVVLNENSQASCTRFVSAGSVMDVLGILDGPHSNYELWWCRCRRLYKKWKPRSGSLVGFPASCIFLAGEKSLMRQGYHRTT